MAINNGGVWSPDDTEIFDPPSVGLHSWLSRMADSIVFPEGTVTQPWRVHYKTTTQSVSNNVFTDASGGTWTAGTGDPGTTASGITHSTSGYTVTEDGWYRIEFDYATVSNATGFRQAQIRVNGNIERTVVTAAVNGSTTTAQCVVERSLSIGDVVSFWVRQNSGASLDTPTGTDACRKLIRRIALL